VSKSSRGNLGAEAPRPTIPEEELGIFLALCDLGLRPGEARAVDVRDGWMTVSRACKGYGADAQISPTKSGKAKRLPLSQELAE